MDDIKTAARAAVLEFLLQPEYGDSFLLETLQDEGVENVTEEKVRAMDEEVMTLLQELAKNLN